MKLNHYRVGDVATSGLFSAVKNFDELLKSIEAFGKYSENKWRSANKIPLDVENIDADDIRNKSKGDAFEVFCEFLYLRKGSEDGLGLVSEFHLAQKDEAGIDAYGKNDYDHNVVLQFKYRSNPKDELTAQDLTYLPWRALVRNVDLSQERVLIIVTTGEGISYILENIVAPRKPYYVVNRSQLEKLTGGKQGLKKFWDDFRSSLVIPQSSSVKDYPPLYEHQVEAISAFKKVNHATNPAQ
jgi:hypothetical protein